MIQKRAGLRPSGGTGRDRTHRRSRKPVRARRRPPATGGPGSFTGSPCARRRPPATGGPGSFTGSPCARDAGQPQRVAPEALPEARARATQATRNGWPYYTRRLHKPYDTFVYSRATPIGVNLSPCEGQAGHPQGVALLYTMALQATRTPRIIVGPPLAGGLRRSIYDGSTGGANAASLVGPPLAGGLRRP
jgi:hypothetical protein